MMFKYNSDPEIKELEKKALKINKEKTENLNYWYNSDFNKRTGDMAWWCYMGNLKEIIERKEN